MTLDGGIVPDQIAEDRAWEVPESSIVDAATLGDGLRIARERSGLTMAELSAETKVHPRFLTALEQNHWSLLPSRVFAIGYVRSYASALGLDEQVAIERFKRESPDTSVPLKPPVGIAFEDVKRNSPRIIAAVVVVSIAVVGWNVFQRVSLMRAPHPSAIAETPESWRTDKGLEEPVDLNAPRAAPPDQTVPALYVTRGLEAQITGVDPNDPEAAAAVPTNASPVQKAFNPRGALYGAPANQSRVVIQANKPGVLVVRSGNGRVFFARQMAAGEAWRAPTNLAATLDVSEPAVFDVYMNGEHSGPLTAVLTQLQPLNIRAEQLARAASPPA